MNCARTSDRKQWENIGKHAAMRGYAIEVVLTGKPPIDALIRAGYERGLRLKEKSN